MRFCESFKVVLSYGNNSKYYQQVIRRHMQGKAVNGSHETINETDDKAERILIRWYVLHPEKETGEINYINK